MPPYALLVDRVAALAAMVPGPESEDVRRVTEICRALSARERHDGRVRSMPSDAALSRDLLRLIETLGRRSANGLPAATLARVAFADLKGDIVQTSVLSREVEDKLAMLGL